tara:strand:- start:151 stop:819 length:669 start_codon:yes stop_codon:yes gene_type:complete
MSGISFNSVYFIELYNKFCNYLLPKPNVRVTYKRKTFNHHNIYKNLYCDILTDKKNNNTDYKNIHENKFRNCLKDIDNQNSIIYWIYKNNIKNLLNYKIVVLDFQTIYDYKNRKELNMQYLKYLSKYLLCNKIIFCIISEINPIYFPKLNYFNPINLVTPYHYKSRTFGGVVKIGINKYGDKSVQVGVNKIINDIMNQYGCNEQELVYINSKKIAKINTIII